MQREALTLASLSHRNIVECVEHFELDGRMILVMAYVPGCLSVGDLLMREGRLPERHVIRIALHVARGLAYADTLHAVHRDIKPDNLLIGHEFGEACPDVYTLFAAPATTVQIADFGLTKGADSIAHLTRVTADGVAVGSPAYMSPEQAHGLEADCRSDMYGLGCTMYHLVTGALPFPGTLPAEILIAKVSCETFPDPRDCGANVSDAFRTVLQTLTALRPAERYQSYEALLPVLERLDRTVNGDTDGAAEATKRGLFGWVEQWLKRTRAD